MASMGKHDEAQRSYSIALQLSKNKSSHAFSRRASAHIELKNWQAAAKDATAALEIDGNDAEAYTARAQAYFQNENYEQAAADFESALNFAPSDENQENLQRCLRAMHAEQEEDEEEEEESPYGGIDDLPEDGDDDYGDVDDAPPPRPPAQRAAPPPPAEDPSPYGEDGDDDYGDIDDAPPPRPPAQRAAPPPPAEDPSPYGEDGDDDYGDIDSEAAPAPPPPAADVYGEDETPYGEDGDDAGDAGAYGEDEDAYGEGDDEYGGGMPAGAQAAYPMASASNPPVQQMQQMQVAAPRSAPRAAAKAPSSKAVLDDEATLRGKTYGQIVFGHLGRVDAEQKLKEACVAGGSFVDGTFLLRSSSTVLGGLVISMFYKGKCYHYQFAKDKAGNYVRSDGKVIGSNVVEFIKYYRRR
eukprot:gene5724-26596_t